MTKAATLLTAEEYLRLPDNGKPTELVRGVVVEMNMPTPRHGQICGQTYFLLRLFVEQHPVGCLVCNDAGVWTERDPDTMRGADVAFYSYSRVPRGMMPIGYLDVVPELVVEVRSRTDRWRQVSAKAYEYLDAGVSVVCVLDEQTQTAHLFRADQAPQALAADADLTFPGILDGFAVPVRRFFE